MYVYMSVRLSVLASFRLCFAQMRSGIGPRETLTRILPQPDQHVRILEGVGQNLQVGRCKQPGVWCRLHGWLTEETGQICFLACFLFECTRDRDAQ